MDLPGHDDPLPIPIQTFDWIRAHGAGGPEGLFESPQVASLLKSGNRLFGSAFVDCPECSIGRTYIIYIVFGESGWFAEVENERRQTHLSKEFFEGDKRSLFRVT